MKKLIKSYAELVVGLARDKVSRRFTNSGPEHAQVVFENLFRTSELSVKLFTGDLDSFFAEQLVVDAAKGFLARDSAAKVEIMFRDQQFADKAATSAFLTALPGGQVEVHVAKPNAFAPMFQGNDFVVSDNRAYRFETDDAQASAVVNFNEPDIAITLSDVFDEAVSKSKSISAEK